MGYRFLIILQVITLMMMTLIMGCAKPSIIYQDYKPEQMIHYSQIQSVEKISNHIIFINKGDMIPLKMNLNSEVLELASDEINLILKQKVYVRLDIPEGINTVNDSAMSEEDKRKIIEKIIIYLSADAKRWAPYNDIKAVEEIFGIKGGTVSFGMGITKEEGIKIFLNATTNRT